MRWISKAAKQKERLAELKAKRKLSPDEQKEYMELRKKYGSLSSNSTDGRVSELEARLNNLQQEKEKLVKNGLTKSLLYGIIIM